MSVWFEPLQLGALRLPNRVLMAPMTRCRSEANGVPSEIMARYYRQRASAGLIISEASQISPQGVGYIFTPGIHSSAQVEGWRKVTEAVHQEGGRIFLQLWHVGRVSHPSFHGGELPVAPSAIGFDGEVFTAQGRQKVVVPRALETSEIQSVVQDFAHGALNAKAAGFDGVEIHGAFGYLIDQFLHDGSNQREDRYGGSIANRARFLFEVTDAVARAWGPGRVGVRLAPSNTFNGMMDSDAQSLFEHAVEGLNEFPLAYLHLMEPALPQLPARYVQHVAEHFRKHYRGALIANNGLKLDAAQRLLESKSADAVAFGRWFVANPDLPERIRTGAKLSEPDVSKFYAGGEQGYIDYPFLN